MASSAGDVPSLRCLQGFREGPLKAGGSWNVRLKGGVGWKVSSEDTPEEGRPLAGAEDREESGAGGAPGNQHLHGAASREDGQESRGRARRRQSQRR